METRKAAMRIGAICLKVAIILMVILGLVYLGQTTYRYAHAVFSDAAYEEAPGTPVKVTISENVSSKYLANVLEEQGIIEDATVFELQMKIQSFGSTVKAGTYQLNSSMKPSEIVDILKGKTEEAQP